MEDIEAGLDALVREIKERNIGSIAIPPLGAGLGGLLWTEVRPRIEEALGDMDDLAVILFEPGEEPEGGRTGRPTKPPSMTRGRAALIGLMDRYLRGMLDPFVTLLEIHKLMYFMQEAGEPLKLRFDKGHYGPYAKNLGHVLQALEGHLISGYEDCGDAPGKQIELVPGAIEDADAFLEERPRTKERLGQVSDLVEGFESSFGLELLATVHWVASKRPSATEEEVVHDTYAWNPNKRQFSKRQILLARKVLREKGWLEGVSTSPVPS